MSAHVHACACAHTCVCVYLVYCPYGYRGTTSNCNQCSSEQSGKLLDCCFSSVSNVNEVFELALLFFTYYWLIVVALL